MRTFSISVALFCLFSAATGTAAAEPLVGRVVGSTDGDTLTLLADRSQYTIRLAEIDTPESGQPWGTRARQALAGKVFRHDVRIEVVDIDRYGRTVGRVWLGERNINREMVREGHAWAYRQYLTDSSLLDDELEAKQASLGLWVLLG